ncbi:MAG: DUF2807 domain-containing protein [Dysgonamonadaceae bacterium]|jgi:hypothetical protein|nr:DUF2807 domain-containing protein [Dysgonamonadaceae bacterium]
MKKIKRFLTALIAVFNIIGMVACIESVRIMNKNYEVSSFNAIESEIVGNVVLTQSDNTSVSAEGSEDLVKNLIVEVKGNKLKLHARTEIVVKNPFSLTKNSTLTVYVSTPDLAKIDLSGVGNLKLNGNVKSDSLFIDLTGVGNLNAEDLECRTLFIESSGVGNITLKGRAKAVKIQSDDVGNIKAKEFIADTVSINSSGVGNITCYASDSLVVEASGVGNVTYFGNPAATSIDSNGVGRVKKGAD